MDDDLRSLERRAAADPSLLPLLLAARARAGLDTGAALAALDRAAAALEAARAAHAVAMVHALGAFVGAAFEERPDLDEVELAWALSEHRDRAWTIHVELRSGRTLEPDLVDGFLRVGHLFASRHEVWGARTLRRVDARVVVDPEGGWSRSRRAGTDEPPLGEREVPFRHVEDLTAPLRGLARDGPFAIGRGTTTTGAGLLAAGAEADLAEATGAFVEVAGAAWDRFVPALLVERPELDVALIHGYSAGYNDNWYDEHEQRVYLGARRFEWILEDIERLGLGQAFEAAGLRTPVAPLAPAIEEAAQRQLERFEHLLRLRHGPDWTLVLARDGPGGVARLGPSLPR